MWPLSSAGGVHDHRYPGQAQGGPDQVVAVGSKAVDQHAPGQGTGHEHPTVGGQDAPEVGIRLEGGDESVEAEGEDPSADEGQAAVFADALP